MRERAVTEPRIRCLSNSCEHLDIALGFPDSSVDKESACNSGDPCSIPGQEDPLEKGQATHSSVLGLP